MQLLAAAAAAAAAETSRRYPAVNLPHGQQLLLPAATARHGVYDDARNLWQRSICRVTCWLRLLAVNH